MLFYLAIFWLAIPYTPSFGQTRFHLPPEKRISQYVHESWQTDNGLPQNSVSSIKQDANGYLWLGTEEGLARFDGIRFSIFDKKTVEAFQINDVVALHTSPSGALWIGTRGGGLLQFSDGIFTGFDSDVELSSDFITSLYEDSRGVLWIGTYGGGLIRKQGNTFTSLGPDEGFEGDFISAIFVDHQNNIWVGTEIGLFQIQQDRFVRVVDTPLSAAFITTIFEDKNQRLWFGTRDQGLFVLKNGEWHHFHDTFMTSNYVTTFLEDTAGSMWLGVTGGHLVRFTGGRLDQYEIDSSYDGNDLIALHQDQEGSLWIGTRGSGLHRLRNAKFTPFAAKEGLSTDRTYSVFENEGGEIWVGTSAGLQLISSPDTLAFTIEDKLSNKEILSVYGDASGNGVWAGTYGEGLFRVKDGDKTSNFTTEQGLVSNNIFALYQDRRQKLWVGTDAGLSIYSDGEFENITPDNGLPSPFITAIEPHHTGAMWIGTYDAGLVQYKAGQFRRITKEEGLGSNGILALHEDAEGALWVGTFGGGLTRIFKDQVTTYTTREGLFNDNVYVILEDDANNLWMSCNKGIFRVNKTDLEQFASGQDSVIHSVVYNKHDGLRNAEATGGQQPAGWKSKDGRLWFPTIAGLVTIDPNHTPVNDNVPSLVIEALDVDNESITLDENLELKAGSNKLAFTFTALSLSIPERVKFSFKMDGIDADWSQPDTRREAFYTNLSPGTYTFRVKASNNDGVWNEEGTTISFYLKPFYYQTTWFKMLLGLGFVVMFFAGYKIRMRQMKLRQQELEHTVEIRTRDLREEKEKTEKAKAVIEAQANKLKDLDRFKTRFFANISHEFRTPLTMIIGPLENAISGLYGKLDDKLTRQVRIMLRNAQRLLRLINQLLDLSKLEAGKMDLHAQRRNIVQFLEGILLSCTPLAEKKEIYLDFKSSAESIILYYEPDKMEKVFFNLLSNALKFTPEKGTIGFTLEQHGANDIFKEGFIEILVTDTGRGIPEKDLAHIFDRFHQVDGSNTREHEGTGIGLALVHELVMLHKGSISVESEVGKGTTFAIRLPMGAAHLNTNQIIEETLSTSPAPSAMTGVITELATESLSFDHEDGETYNSEEEPEADFMLGNKLVLVVDDNTDVREYVSSILSDHYVVETAIDGVDGLEKTKRLRPDLVISDVMMPRMDGNELCRLIKENLDLDHIPVILLTARATNDLRIEGLEMGADDYLSKPFNAKELLVRARNLMLMRHQEKELKFLNEELEEKVADQLRQMLNERLKYEEELVEAKERAESSSQLKSNILDNINHEFRTPIAGIIGSADILTMEAPEDLQEFIGYIKQSTYRLQNTLDAVVELSSLETNHFKLNPIQLDFRQAVEDVVQRFGPMAEQKGLQVHVALPSSPVVIISDDRALTRILDHLLDNAVKFTEHGSISFNLFVEEGTARLEITDTGVGFSEDFKPSLFEAFVQESGGTSRSYEGVGIGLSISIRLAEKLGATLEAVSQKNIGSTFTLSFPLFRVPSQTLAPTKDQHSTNA